VPFLYLEKSMMSAFSQTSARGALRY